MRLKALTLRERFDKKWIPEPYSGCWLWTASIDTGGYGQIKKTDRLVHAHRVSWELHNGPIPEGLDCLHQCNTRACVNPDHLWLGTAIDNMKHCYAEGRRNIIDNRGEKNGVAKLTASDVREIRTTKGAQREIAKRFNVSQTRISKIKRGEAWSHIP